MSYSINQIAWAMALVVSVSIICLTVAEVSSHPFVIRIETDNNTVKIAELANNVSIRQADNVSYMKTKEESE